VSGGLSMVCSSARAGKPFRNFEAECESRIRNGHTIVPQLCSQIAQVEIDVRWQPTLAFVAVPVHSEL
jgi:hypothetical protein